MSGYYTFYEVVDDILHVIKEANDRGYTEHTLRYDLNNLIT